MLTKDLAVSAPGEMSFLTMLIMVRITICESEYDIDSPAEGMLNFKSFFSSVLLFLIASLIESLILAKR